MIEGIGKSRLITMLVGIILILAVFTVITNAEDKALTDIDLTVEDEVLKVSGTAVGLDEVVVEFYLYTTEVQDGMRAHRPQTVTVGEDGHFELFLERGGEERYHGNRPGNYIVRVTGEGVDPVDKILEIPGIARNVIVKIDDGNVITISGTAVGLGEVVVEFYLYTTEVQDGMRAHRPQTVLVGEDGQFQLTLERGGEERYHGNRAGRYIIRVAGEGVSPVDTPLLVLTDIWGHWAQEDINKLIALGINGYPDGTFRPDNKITKAELATILVKAYKLQGSMDSMYEDTTGHWANNDISIVVNFGLMELETQEVFGVNNTVTGSDFIKILDNLSEHINKALVNDNEMEDISKELSRAEAISLLLNSF